MIKQELYVKHSCIPEHDGYVAEMQLFPLGSEVTTYFHGISFLLEHKTKTNMVIKPVVFGRHFSEMNKVSLS